MSYFPFQISDEMLSPDVCGREGDMEKEIDCFQETVHSHRTWVVPILFLVLSTENKPEIDNLQHLYY